MTREDRERRETKVTVWLDTRQLAELDDALHATGYKSRAEWLRERIRQFIAEVRASR